MPRAGFFERPNVTYALLSDMEARFDTSELIQLTDEAAQGVVDEAAMDTALQEADDLINSYLGLYSLPLATTPGILRDKACDIARYRLYKTEAPEGVRTRYKDAVDWLKLISEGKAKLDIAAGVTAPLKSDAVITADSVVRTKRDSMRGF